MVKGLQPRGQDEERRAGEAALFLSMTAIHSKPRLVERQFSELPRRLRQIRCGATVLLNDNRHDVKQLLPAIHGPWHSEQR